MGRRARLGRLLALVVVAFAAVVGPARSAAAHANVVSSSPGDGESLPVAPNRFTIRFDERIDPALAVVRLVPAEGSPVELRVHRSGSSTIEADLPPLGPGVHRVRYDVRDPIDLHPTAGTVVFGVGDVAVLAAGSSLDARPPAIDVGLRWAERIGLALLVGGTSVALLVVPRARAGARAARTALVTAAGGAVVQAASLLGLVVREAVAVDGAFASSLRRLFSSGAFGRRAVAGIVVAVVFVALVRLVAPTLDDATVDRWRGRRWGEPGGSLLALAVGACLLVSLAGHAATGGSFATGAAIRLVHLLATGAWAGGLAVVLLVARRHGRQGALTRAFGALAGPAVALAIVSGLLLTGREIDTVTGLLGSWFGRQLLAKLVLVAGAAALGLRHARRLARGAEAHRAGLLAEAVVAVLVIGGGAALSATPPAVGRAYEPAPPTSPAPEARTVGDVTVRLSLRPNRPGANLVTATVVSSRKPAPAAVEGVQVSLRPATGASPVEASGGSPTGGVVELGTVQLAADGAYVAEVRVARPGAPVEPLTFALQVDPPAVPRARTVVSDAPIATVVRALAIAAAGTFVALSLVRRRRRAGTSPTRRPDDDQPLLSQAGRRAS